MFLLVYILRCQLYVVCFAVLCVLGRCRVWCVSFCVCCVFCVASSALSIHSFIHFLGFSKSVLLVFLISRSRPYAFSRMMIAAFLLFSIFRFPDSWISWFFDFQIFSFWFFRFLGFSIHGILGFSRSGSLDLSVSGFGALAISRILNFSLSGLRYSFDFRLAVSLVSLLSPSCLLCFLLSHPRFLRLSFISLGFLQLCLLHSVFFISSTFLLAS